MSRPTVQYWRRPVNPKPTDNLKKAPALRKQPGARPHLTRRCDITNRKPCSRCKTQPRLAWGTYCRDCRNEYRREYYRRNHEENKRRVRLDAWKRQGIDLTWEQYEQLLDDQDHVCAICEQSPGNRALHVDHHHDTGRVRGLLCSGCNTALGSTQEDPDILHRMANYLKQHQPITR